MHYYYDILANFDTDLWEFYEWEQSDNIVPIKKIPLVKVSEKDIKNFLKYQVKFDAEEIKKYKEKTIIKNQKEKNTCILFSSAKNNIVLEINDDGSILAKSKLLMEDENNCNELSYSLKETKIPYKIENRLPLRNDFRQASSEKRLIEVELKTLKETKNIKKCTYLYYEWFGIYETNLDKMIQDIKGQLQKEYNLKIHEIASLIKISYKERL